MGRRLLLPLSDVNSQILRLCILGLSVPAGTLYDIMFDVMNRIIIQLPPDLLEALDLAAEEDGMARSKFIRDSVARALFERRRRRELQQVVDSYTALPPQRDEFIPQDPKTWPE
jgi:hypothetical protein